MCLIVTSSPWVSWIKGRKTVVVVAIQDRVAQKMGPSYLIANILKTP